VPGRIDPTLSASIERWLRDYLVAGRFRDHARRLGALPIYADMGGCILLRPDCE